MSFGTNRGAVPSADGRLTLADIDTALNAGLAETKSKQGRASLLHVREALQSLHVAGTKITFSNVGDYCVNKHGGPTKQSIQNNIRTARLLQVARAVQSAAKRPRGDKPTEVAILEQIGDLERRSEAEGMLAHRRQLIVLVNELRLAARTSRAIGVVSEEMAKVGIETLEDFASKLEELRQSTPEAVFSDEERQACGRFLKTGLAALDYKVDPPSGEIVDRTSRTVADRGVASALAKVAAL